MIPFTSIQTLFAKLHRELGKRVEEGDVIEMTGEALDFLEAPQVTEEAVAFCEVKNNTVRMPSGTKSIIQIAKNNNWSKNWTVNTACNLGDAYSTGDPTAVVEDNVLCPAVIEQEVQEDPECEYALQDAYGRIITNYEPVYYRPYFDLRYNYDAWVDSGYYGAHYTPVRLSSNTFFDTVVCKETNWEDIYRNSFDEYVPDWPYLKFSFSEGSVAISYIRTRLDEDGYPMIPDRAEYLNAITAYIRWKISERMVDIDPKMMPVADRNRRLWKTAASQAVNYAKLPSIDQMQNITEMRSYLIPRVQGYYGFFGNLNRQEVRTYKTPTGRSRHRWTS
jgi:hypothetical protein